MEPFLLPPTMRPGLGLLLKAYDYAGDVSLPVWDFAVERTSLHAAGLSDSDLRWLVCKGYAEHATEIRPGTRLHRLFRPAQGLKFTNQTCAVLTAAGAACVRHAAGQYQKGLQQAFPPGLPRNHLAPENGLLVPCWDSLRRELRLGERVVKRYKQPAPSQELVLAAFQEEGWPCHIDDPLPPHPEQDTKRQLHNTINNLNRHHHERLIRFLGNGTGQAICWEFLC